jgi:hypothetical protein
MLIAAADQIHKRRIKINCHCRSKKKTGKKPDIIGRHPQPKKNGKNIQRQGQEH